MSIKQGNKPLSSRAIEVMKPEDKVRIDLGENRSLRVVCGNAGTKIFYCRYNSPPSSKQKQMEIGNYPMISLAETRIRLRDLRVERRSGKCSTTELSLKKQQFAGLRGRSNAGKTLPFPLWLICILNSILRTGRLMAAESLVHKNQRGRLK